jgi:cellulose synthase (UDP-forming)
MFSELTSLALLVAVLALGGWGLSRLSPLDPFYRQSMCWAVLATNAIYLYWRLAHTLPETLEPRTLLAWLYLGIEMLALAEVCLFWLCLSRTTEQAGPREPAPAWPGEPPLVEIWIPTYQEPLEVLEKSILAAQGVDWPRLKVRVLDDGARSWLREQCAVWGAEHVTRAEHKHAKAGNLNHALASSQADFVVVMDADFAAHHDFVRRVLPFFQDARLAVLQTPQVFYNPDMAQQNLGLGGRIADEQALFFREIQPARDAWNAAFFCGSCAMLRVSAMRDVGGFPTDSITEDLLTSLRLLGRGWTTRYLNQHLSMGLAAESISAFFLQRDRWSRGAIEVLFLQDGPLRNPRLTLMQRLLFMPLYWLISPFFHMAVMLLPMACLITGLDVMFIDNPADVPLLVLPTVLINLMGLTWVSRGRFAPVISTAMSMLMAARLCYSALAGLFRPGKAAFKVTPKGSQTQASSDRLLFNVMMALTLGTLAAMVYAGWVSHAPPNSEVNLPWMIFLGAFNLLHFLIALVLVEDKPRQRAEERFRILQTMRLIGPQGLVLPVQMQDMSVSGLRFRAPEGMVLPQPMQLELEGQTLPLDWMHTRQAPGRQVDVVCQFDALDAGQRRALIQFLFGGRFNPLLQDAPSLLNALGRTARSVFAPR